MPGYSGSNDAAAAATSAAIAASLSSPKSTTAHPSAQKYDPITRKVSPSPVYDLRQSRGNSSTALRSAAAAAKSVSSKPNSSHSPLKSENTHASAPMTRSQSSAVVTPRISITVQQANDSREHHYQLNASSSMEAPRGRNMSATDSAIRSPSAAAAAAAVQSANRHRTRTLSGNFPLLLAQTAPDPVVAAAKSFTLSVSPSPRYAETSVLATSSESPRRLTAALADSKDIQSRQSLRTPSPTSSSRSKVSLLSSLDKSAVARPIAEQINASGASDNDKQAGDAKANFAGAKIQAAKRAMVESQRLANEEAQKQEEQAAMRKSSGAVIAAKLIAKRGEDEAKAEERANARQMSQAQAVISKPTPVEVLSPRPQRLAHHSILSTERDNGIERVSASASNYTESVQGHSEESGKDESISPVSQSFSDQLFVPWLEMVRSESCPPATFIPPRRSSSSGVSRVNVVKTEPKSVAGKRAFSEDKTHLSHGSSHPASVAASQVLRYPPRRLSRVDRIFQPFHSYNRFSAGADRGVTAVSSPASGKSTSIYGSAQASLSTTSLPAPQTIPGDQRLSRLSTEFAPMRRTPLRTTMRKPEKKKHMFNADKPWKHLIVSGTISEPERKRYGALWAANKGTLLPLELSDCVHNLVVRRVWERSRLNVDTLEKIW
ncbi:hypothetical protein V1517DRAFT_314401 [Lipomyces orientalis]|uniref:Uncharacterized protein n=1 Tax=Lipomyces orientalis TaxID=1233043 RepID=A0ACC3TWZ3_9ASCO